MPLVIELPQVGESVVEGTIGKWLKQPGDQVDRYEPLVEVITDKVTMEVPSPVKGTLVKILAEEGEVVPMGAPLAEIETSEGIPEGMAEGKQGAPTPGEAVPSSGTTGYLLSDVKPVGPTGGGPVEEQPAPVARSSSNGALRVSPAVRRLARQHNIDLSFVVGTGMGGRITRDDVVEYVESAGGQPQAVAPSPNLSPDQAVPGEDAPREAPAPAGEETAGAADEEYVSLTPVRRLIAEAMVRSVSQIPHAWSMVEVDVSGLVARRAAVRSDFEQRNGVDLTYLPFIIKVVAESLRENPTLNATWGGDKIILKRRINLGIAVAAPTGLIVPVIHDADRLSIAGLAHALRDLTQRARQNRLTLEDVQQGTFTLNNTGALGSTVSQPIINHPQAAILTTEAIQKRPVVVNDAIAIRAMMNLCMSFDHRINDGAEASGFLQSVKGRLEAIGPDTAIY
ncbi:MAG: 2-oxo acid dehydrogenase subunit E2 [Chloroflexi bacterium]|nr:2-oxo acid dehydrogenase subunit E2 [Chloroflexota bacterium]